MLLISQPPNPQHPQLQSKHQVLIYFFSLFNFSPMKVLQAAHQHLEESEYSCRVFHYISKLFLFICVTRQLLHQTVNMNKDHIASGF